MKRFLCLILCLLMLAGVASIGVSAANSADAEIIRNIEITGVHTPYAGYRPDYGCNLGSVAYTFDDQLDHDPEVYKGRWWYDETSKSAVAPEETFVYGHIYSICVLLVPTEGYEFRVDNFNTPFISATVNGETAQVKDDLTNKRQTFVEYTFEPCDYNYEISEVSVSVTEPVPGEYPDFNVEINPSCVIKDETESPDCIFGVAWYDYKTCTYMNPSDVFEEDGIYEANIFLTTAGDYYFSTENDKTDVKVFINGEEGIAETAGKNDKYHIRVAGVVYGDAREVVEYIEIIDVKRPSVGANPVFDATPADEGFYISGVFWTDVTNSSAVSMKETDTFLAGHTYKLEVWIRAKEGYKFCTDADGYIDIMALLGGEQADVYLPGSEISAELSVTFTLSADTLVSFVEIMYVDAPIEGNTPDMDALCTTQGCNVSKVEWFDVTEGRGVLISKDDTFEAGRKYLVCVTVDAEGNYAYEQDDMGVNAAAGYINGQKAIVYGSYDEKVLELGYEFAPCAENPTKPGITGAVGDANCDGDINIKDATAIQKHIAMLESLTDTGFILADVDASSDVNIKDATAIQKKIAGLN